jgi:hypothetical protein
VVRERQTCDRPRACLTEDDGHIGSATWFLQLPEGRLIIMTRPGPTTNGEYAFNCARLLAVEPPDAVRPHAVNAGRILH